MHINEMNFILTTNYCLVKLYFVPMGLMVILRLHFYQYFVPKGTVPLGTKYG